MIKIRAFRAINNPTACQEYLKGHMQVLIDYNVMKVTSYNQAWTSNPSVYVLTAEMEETGVMVGGIRIEITKGDIPLPIETAIGKLDSRIYKLVEQYGIDGGVGELCGLWNSKEIKGLGASFFLTRAAISVINQINFKTLIGICAEYTLEMFTNVGFEIDHSLGNNGEFPYPDERYITRALGILNAETLKRANPFDRDIILGLRANPTQTREEIGSKGPVKINYDLIIENPDTLVYKSKNNYALKEKVCS
ncbi:MAG: hypothetical protein ACK504_10280 [Bacteroidota bacterium]